jgi:ATP-dependent helicase/nuclease subunit A
MTGGPADDRPVEALADARARARISGADPAGLAETLFVEAGAGSGKTRALVDRVVALVAAGEQVNHLAAITFTEKAAAELRDRIRRALEQRAAEEPDDPRWRAACGQVDGAAISTLHAFAQRLLTERPVEAGLPPNVEVLDEVASQVEFEDRWQRFRTRLLDDTALHRSLLLAFAVDVKLDHLRALAVEFDANFDLVRAAIDWAPVEPPGLDAAGLADRIDAVCALGDHCHDEADLLLVRVGELSAFAERLRAAPDEFEALRLVGARPSFRPSGGRKGNWHGIDPADIRVQLRELGDELETEREQVAVRAVQRLAVAVRDFVLEAAEQRRTSGRLEFHDLLVLARALLRGPDGPAVRRDLGRRYRRLLLDEFQDTDPIQIELAVLLASDDPSAGDLPWPEVPVRPGALFFVGDPKQSIYRFRRADIGLFLRAREAFGGQTPSAPLTLSTNFRTTPPVIAWVNHTFARAITAEPDSQPAYVPLDPAPARTQPPVGPPVMLLGAGEHPGASQPAEETRRLEAHDVAAAVVTALAEGWSVRAEPDTAVDGWRPARAGDITILLPARTSLPALEAALDARGIAYRAETSSLVYSTAEVRDLMAALRAVADPTDQLALVTALRSPLFGCGDDDLARYRLRYGGRWDLRARLPDELDLTDPVAEALTVLRRLHADAAWSTPSELLDRLVRERRVLELGFARGRQRDVWRRIRFVVDQAREWSDAQGGTLRQYLAWAGLQASESTRVAETVLPETDDDAVRIMTVHGAKGLEFPITIVSGMSTQPQIRRSGVQVLWDGDRTPGLRIGGKVTTPEFRDLAPIDEQMSYHERVRLLYVACTRACDHLVVSLHRRARKHEPATTSRTSAEILAAAAAEAPHAVPFTAPPAAPPTAPPAAPPRAPAAAAEPPALPDFADWQAQRSTALATGAVPRTVAATGIARLAAVPESAESAAGLAKAPRDLELPPWVRGRYGTAVGRAVHAVLQTVELATGAGLQAAVAAQAAAEGVVGREEVIARLARAALAAPAVRAAVEGGVAAGAAGGRSWWRETYVAAPVDLGDGRTRVLEGYVDLLYRRADGLVVVDYKTAGDDADLQERTAGYRLQGAAYALVVAAATGEPVADVVFVYLTPQGAVEHRLTDLDAATAEVRTLLAGADGDRLALAAGLAADPGDPIPA